MDVTQQLLASSETSGQTVVICTAPPESTSAGALRMLSDLAAA